MQITFNKEHLTVSGNAEDCDFTIRNIVFNHADSIISVSNKASGILLEKFGVLDENDVVEIQWSFTENTFIKVANLLKL